MSVNEIFLQDQETIANLKLTIEHLKQVIANSRREYLIEGFDIAEQYAELYPNCRAINWDNAKDKLNEKLREE